jgi:hypothetical protein
MTNPFKPGSGLFPPYFADRQREIELFENKLTQTINGAPMHMAVIGDWATGKTSLLKKYREIAETKKCFVSDVISPVTDSIPIFVQTILNAVKDDLKRKDGAKFFKKIKGKLQKIEGISISAFGFGASVKQSKSEIISPQFDLHIGFRAIWESISSKYKSIILLIDDFDLITNNEKIMKEAMLTLRNSLMEAINDNVKIMSVVSGATLHEKFESIHGPLIRFFEPFEIRNLEPKYAKLAITEPLKTADVKFKKNVIDRILEVTNCHPYYLQEFCYILYENNIKNIVDMNIFEATYSKILHDLARKMWNQKIKELSDISVKILYLIAKGFNKSEDLIIQGEKRFKINENNIRVTLSRLQQVNIISRVARGEYGINDKLFGEYIISLLSE